MDRRIQCCAILGFFSLFNFHVIEHCWGDDRWCIFFYSMRTKKQLAKGAWESSESNGIHVDRFYHISRLVFIDRRLLFWWFDNRWVPGAELIFPQWFSKIAKKQLFAISWLKSDQWQWSMTYFVETYLQSMNDFALDTEDRLANILLVLVPSGTESLSIHDSLWE